MKQIYKTLKWVLCMWVVLNISTAAAQDTICLSTSSSLQARVIADFATSRKSDSVLIMGKSTRVPYTYTVSYETIRTDYLPSNPSDNESINSNGIVNVKNLKNLSVTCRITYRCNIKFNLQGQSTNETFPDDKNTLAYWEKILFNTPGKSANSTTGEFSSDFVWTKNYVLHKTFAVLDKTPTIGGDCFTGQITLTNSNANEFSDIKKYQWYYDATKWDASNTNRHSITLNLKPNVDRDSFLTSDISYTIYDCANNSKTALKVIKNNITPKPMITGIPSCISTDEAGMRQASVISPYSGVNYYWALSSKSEGSEMQVVYLPNPNGTTLSFPIDHFREYDLSVTASGGCNNSLEAIKITRRLGSNVAVKVVESESCIVDGDIIHFTTEPRLPNLLLDWSYPKGALSGTNQTNDYKTYKVVKGTGIINNNKTVSVRSAACPPTEWNTSSPLSKNLDVKEKIQLQMTARVNINAWGSRTLNKVDTVPCNAKITFNVTTTSDMIEGYVWHVVEPLHPSLTFPTVEPILVWQAPGASMWRYVNMYVSTCNGDYTQNGIEPVTYSIYTRCYSVIDPPVINPPVTGGDF